MRSTRWRAAGVATDGGRLLVTGGGARSAAYRQVLADLAQRPVTVVDAEDPVATGACVQAAATLTAADPLEVVEAWSLGAGRVVEPDPTVDAAAVRAAYHQAISA